MGEFVVGEFACGRIHWLPGSLLGYRSLHKKVREVHRLKVPRNLVYDVMADVYPKGLEERGGVGTPKRPKRTGTFTSNVSKNISVSFNIIKSLRVMDIQQQPPDYWKILF